VTPNLLLFDLDGTLVDSQHMILAAQAKAFAAFSMPMPERDRALSIVGLSLYEAFRALVGPEGPIDGLVAAYKQAFFELRRDNQVPEHLFEGAADLLGALAGREAFVLGIATGKSRRGVDALIEKHGWHGRFATIQTADDAPSKPHPAMVLQAAAETDLAPARILMIGDSSFDMQMGRSAGARTVGVAWGFQPRDALRAAGADRIVETFAELQRVIDDLDA
jgi:phosphoglycolate phosphatase